MTRRGPSVHDRITMRIVVDLRNVSPPEGQLDVPGAAARASFSGWLGLLRALEDVLAEGAADAELVSTVEAGASEGEHPSV